MNGRDANKNIYTSEFSIIFRFVYNNKTFLKSVSKQTNNSTENSIMYWALSSSGVLLKNTCRTSIWSHESLYSLKKPQPFFSLSLILLSFSVHTIRIQYSTKRKVITFNIEKIFLYPLIVWNIWTEERLLCITHIMYVVSS